MGYFFIVSVCLFIQSAAEGAHCTSFTVCHQGGLGCLFTISNMHLFSSHQPILEMTQLNQ